MIIIIYWQALASCMRMNADTVQTSGRAHWALSIIGKLYKLPSVNLTLRAYSIRYTAASVETFKDFCHKPAAAAHTLLALPDSVDCSVQCSWVEQRVSSGSGGPLPSEKFWTRVA